MVKVTISGVTGCRNRGVEALVRVIIDEVRKRGVDEVSVLTASPSYDLHRFGSSYPNVQFHADALVTTVGGIVDGLGALRFAVPSKLKEPWSTALKAVDQSNMLIVTGGDLFGADYPGFQRHLRVVQRALNSGVPVVFHAHSIGPFENGSQWERFADIAQQAYSISVRESISLAYLQQRGLTGVTFCPDPAFLLEPVARRVIDRIFASYGVDSGRPTVAVCPSQGISVYSGQESHAHFEALLAAVRQFVEFDAQVLLVPHVQERWVRNDDRVLATDLARAMDYPQKVRVIAGDHTAAELKGIISVCDLVLAERMHAALAGLSTGVPTAVLAYSRKAIGIIGDIYGDLNEAYHLTLPVEEFIRREEYRLHYLNDLWTNRETLRAQLRRVVGNMRDQAREGIVQNLPW